jgi:chromosome partitioning protein
MAHVISVVNQKGGVGKTTTAINLAAFLASKGKFVLLIDMDSQCNATSGLGFDIHQLNSGIYEVLIEGAAMNDVILKTDVDGLSVVPATIPLAGAAVEMVGLEDREYRLAQAIQSVSNHYDYVIIDCPPSLGLITVNCLLATDQVLIPVQAEYYALEGLSQLLNTVHLVKENVKPELDVLGAVVTMYDRRNLLSFQVRQELRKHFPYHVFNAVIPRNIRLTEAPSHGVPISEYAPSSKGAHAYERLAHEILEIHK